MKTSACRDETLKNQPNQMGMTPHHEGSIPTCACFHSETFCDLLILRVTLSVDLLQQRMACNETRSIVLIQWSIRSYKRKVRAPVETVDEKRLPTGKTIASGTIALPSALSTGDFTDKQRKAVG